MREFKYKATFASVLKCVTPTEKNKYLALASLQDLKRLLPSTSLDDEDLLPIAANVCVANVANKNGDVISTATALKIYERFKHKYINVEHDQEKIVGHIVNASLSRFDTDYATGVGSEVLDPKDLKPGEPFNISIGGYIYRKPAKNVTAKILDSNDPNSEDYLALAVSWEIGFDEYSIALGSEALGECKLLNSPEDIAKYTPYLIAEGGSGKTMAGEYVSRLLDSPDELGVVPLGIGLTFTPAGSVAGVVTPLLTQKAIASVNSENNSTEDTNKISHSTPTNVTNNTPIMKKFTSLAEITSLNDETVKDYSFANVGHVITAAIEDAAKAHQSALAAEKQDKEAAKAALDQAVSNAKVTEAKVKELETTISDLQQKQQTAEAAAKYQSRMAGLDEEYELTPELRTIISSEITGLDDKGFEAYAKKAGVLFSDRSKSALAAKKKADDAKMKDDSAKDGKKEPDEDDADKAKKAIASAKPTATASVSSPATDESLSAKFATAFKVGDGGITITK